MQLKWGLPASRAEAPVVPTSEGRWMSVSERQAPRVALRSRRGLAVSAGVSCACVLCACGTSDVPVLLAPSGADAQATAPRPPALGTLGEYCAGSGPPALVASLADGGLVSTCPSQLAGGALRYALCTCGSVTSDHAIVTDAFDGSRRAYGPSTAFAGGSVGVDGALHPTGLLQIGGSLWASAPTDITTSAVQIAGELHAEGEIHPAPTLSVEEDAWMAGGIQTTGDVTVKGALHVPSGSPIDVTGTRSFGVPNAAPFHVAPPCDCAPNDIVGVAGVVATYLAHNDDAALGIDPTMLENVQSDVAMTLPCGRIFFTRIGANVASIRLTVARRVALFVGGDLSVADFEIDAPPGAEVDLFVSGSVSVRGAFRVGDASNQAGARTYVGGPGVNLQGAATLAGSLYAPGSVLTLGASAPTTVYGSIFASS
ncbi:MAG: DUF7305 domain-containing protein, partial [Polyangiaceae bacterium]